MEIDTWSLLFGGVMALLGQAIMGFLLASDSKIARRTRSLFSSANDRLNRFLKKRSEQPK